MKIVDKASEAVIANTHTGYRHRVTVRPGEDALDVFAREEGYDSWKEMRRYSSLLDLEHHWIVERTRCPTSSTMT